MTTSLLSIACTILLLVVAVVYKLICHRLSVKLKYTKSRLKKAETEIERLKEDLLRMKQNSDPIARASALETNENEHENPESMIAI